MDDQDLLRNFVQCQSEEAFRTLVDRHLPMVYATARRMVQDAHLAEDIAQEAFTLLAQKAPVLGRPQVVGGWLYNTTRHLALHALRTEQRRRQREEATVTMQPIPTEPETGGLLEQLEPAMAELTIAERDAVVMRYLENRSLRELGEELGISEDAARMRVNRALERLRGILAQRGLAVTSVVLDSTLVSTTGTALPTGLAGMIATSAVAAAAVGGTATATGLATAWWNAKAATALLAVALMAGSGTYLLQQQHINRLRMENQRLAIQPPPTPPPVTVAGLNPAEKEELERLRQDGLELLRLRNEVAQLRREHAAAQERTATQRGGTPGAPSAGAFLRKEQFAHVGYATPEAALQSYYADMASHNYAQLRADNIKLLQKMDPSKPGEYWLTNTYPMFTPESFDKENKARLGGLLGMQLLATRVKHEDQVEIELLVFREGKAPELTIENVLRVGNEWKYYAGKSYDPNWGRDGQVQLLTPTP